jgi:hypothetical protein
LTDHPEQLQEVPGAIRCFKVNFDFEAQCIKAPDWVESPFVVSGCEVWIAFTDVVWLGEDMKIVRIQNSVGVVSTK